MEKTCCRLLQQKSADWDFARNPHGRPRDYDIYTSLADRHLLKNGRARSCRADGRAVRVRRVGQVRGYSRAAKTAAQRRPTPSVLPEALQNGFYARHARSLTATSIVPSWKNLLRTLQQLAS